MMDKINKAGTESVDFLCLQHRNKFKILKFYMKYYPWGDFKGVQVYDGCFKADTLTKFTS